ncbi:MAG TPA: hydroxymethylglutaryl-CoA lyase [Bacillota bacterium]|nr:hydroxymethylglutaryl-CoA lyase [Bacillota bacterium]
MLSLPRTARVNEVVARDGFQNERQFLPTAYKISLINRLAELGVRKIETTAFVSPKAVPQLADAEQVVRGINRLQGVVYSALVPNLKGAGRAIACGIDELNVVVSASTTHNQKNLGMRVEQSLEQIRAVVETAGTRTRVGVSIATAFGCPYEGEVPRDKVLGLAEHFRALSVNALTLADTTGMAVPDQVYGVCRKFAEVWPELDLTLHFHNTRGLGLANVLAGLAAGVTSFDSCLGGLGGCPFAPGATGNICTEDLVHMLEGMNIATGIGLRELISLAGELEQSVGHALPGQVARAGTRWDLHPKEE